jgi:protein SPT2
MSFDDLMKKAKEQSLSKGNKTEPKAPQPPKKYASHDSNSDNTPTLYHRLKRPEPSKSTTSNHDAMSARERARQLVAEPPKKLNVQKRDRRTIADVQREIRHKKGIYSDEEEDSRSMGRNNRSRPGSHGRSQRSPPPSAPVDRRKRPVSPPIARPLTKRPLPPVDRRAAPPPVRRMPFSGRPLDAAARKTVPKRRYREEEEEEIDEELASFIVDDEEDDDDPRYSRGPRRNSYSEEISKIFKYDRSR